MCSNWSPRRHCCSATVDACGLWGPLAVTVLTTPDTPGLSGEDEGAQRRIWKFKGGNGVIGIQGRRWGFREGYGGSGEDMGVMGVQGRNWGLKGNMEFEEDMECMFVTLCQRGETVFMASSLADTPTVLTWPVLGPASTEGGISASCSPQRSPPPQPHHSSASCFLQAGPICAGQGQVRAPAGPGVCPEEPQEVAPHNLPLAWLAPQV